MYYMVNCNEIKNHIKNVSLGGEYGDSGRITKFTTPIIYWYFAKDSQHTQVDKKHIISLFDELSSLIHIQFIESQTTSKPHIMIYIGDQSTFNTYLDTPITEKSVLGWASWYAQYNEIYKSSVFVCHTTSGIQRREILREEITQALGNTGDTSYDNTVFYQYKQNYYDKYFANDKYLLRFLYHPHTKPGMTYEHIDKLDCDEITQRCTEHYTQYTHDMGHNNTPYVVLLVLGILCVIYK